jgi:hypothetical protein
MQSMNIAGFGDFTGNGISDVLWENPANGVVGDWLVEDEVAWWGRRAIDPLAMSRMLWVSTRRIE